jgi:hypothetical protein
LIANLYGIKAMGVDLVSFMILYNVGWNKEVDSWSNFEYALREETDCSLTRCYPNATKMKT